ncbi:fluoride efflux transporter CrcB [Flaviflexus massiliensis]|uniref:fluoride efflux transporter CrcB n=1 Tax=Flaviflexus massiliensis TaxID=1522309 RepID=UPI0006D55EE4|nr:fluoride efflux transporter CrcB [Flaviflexus massiliensis]
MSVAGGLGAATRYSIDKFIQAHTAGRFPWGVFTINVTGSFLMGILAGLVLTSVASPTLQIILGTGFLGGYTTFSTASHDTVTLIREGHAGKAITSSMGNLIITFAAALVGLAVTGAL